MVELESRGKQLLNPRIQIDALEVHDDPGAIDRVGRRMQREGGVALGALKAGVARWRVNDERKAHIAVERDIAIKVSDGERYLIEIHGNLYLRTNA